MIALDSNILVRIVAADDAQQTATARNLIDSQACFVTLTVALELEWVLRSLYASPRDKIAHALEGLLDLPNLNFERETMFFQHSSCTARDSTLRMLCITRRPPAAMHSRHSIAI